MITFTVEDLGPDGQRLSLRDQHGQLHVARVLSRGRDARTDRAGDGMTDPAVPEVHDGLFGQEAVLGERVLVNQATHKPVPVRFEALGCTQGQALELLHPLAQPAPRRPSCSGEAWAVPQLD